MEIEAEIEKIEYHPLLCKPLPQVDFPEFIAGNAFRRSSFLLQYAPHKTFAVSHWRSPKRTRTYPYARVYDTLGYDARVTIVPFVKDEGFVGDRDFMQWDTVSLMSLLKVYVIPAYYKSAVRSQRYAGKITQQVLDFEYISERFMALAQFNQSDAVHWNMNEIREQGLYVARQAASNYASIESKLGIRMHSIKELENRIETMLGDVESYRARSRANAMSAQKRESETNHAAERLRGHKALLTIKNFIGGYYYWTADEAQVAGSRLFLVEKKHSSKHPLPSIGDIKDALLRMILFCNLTNVRVDDKQYAPRPVIGLTSDRLSDFCHSGMNGGQIARFFEKNKLKPGAQSIIRDIFGEAQTNRFDIVVGSPTMDVSKILG